MEVNPNAGTGSTQRVTGRTVVTPRARVSARDSASFGDAEAVNRALQQTPDIRAEAIQRAGEKSRDNQYPPLEIVQAISHLLAKNLSPNDSQQ